MLRLSCETNLPCCFAHYVVAFLLANLKKFYQESLTESSRNPLLSSMSHRSTLVFLFLVGLVWNVHCVESHANNHEARDSCNTAQCLAYDKVRAALTQQEASLRFDKNMGLNAKEQQGIYETEFSGC